MKADFVLLNDTPQLSLAWESPSTMHAVLGKNAHDARLVAAMVIHGVSHLLTFNDQGFRRFPGIIVLIPAAVAVPPSPGP